MDSHNHLLSLITCKRVIIKYLPITTTRQMAESAQTIIIDNGSGMIKAGFAEEESPRAVFDSIVGRKKVVYTIESVRKSEYEYIGDEAGARRDILNLSYPIVAGIVDSWENMEKVWHHTFYNKLRVDPAEAVGVFLTEAPRNPKQNREKMTSIMFETFQVKNVYVALSGVMSLYAAGRTTGLACHAGDDVTHAIPVYEGFSIPQAVEKMEIAGRVLTEWMQKLLLTHGIIPTFFYSGKDM
jgi:actin